MDSVMIDGVLDKLPNAELDETLNEFVAPFAQVLPDERFAPGGPACGARHRSW